MSLHLELPKHVSLVTNHPMFSEDGSYVPVPSDLSPLSGVMEFIAALSVETVAPIVDHGSVNIWLSVNPVGKGARINGQHIGVDGRILLAPDVPGYEDVYGVGGD